MRDATDADVPIIQEIYARHVLRLDPMDPLGVAPDYALRGTLIHDALGRFTLEGVPTGNSREISAGFKAIDGQR